MADPLARKKRGGRLPTAPQWVVCRAPERTGFRPRLPLTLVAEGRVVPRSAATSAEQGGDGLDRADRPAPAEDGAAAEFFDQLGPKAQVAQSGHQDRHPGAFQPPATSPYPSRTAYPNDNGAGSRKRSNDSA